MRRPILVDWWSPTPGRVRTSISELGARTRSSGRFKNQALPTTSTNAYAAIARRLLSANSSRLWPLVRRTLGENRDRQRVCWTMSDCGTDGLPCTLRIRHRRVESSRRATRIAACPSCPILVHLVMAPSTATIHDRKKMN